MISSFVQQCFDATVPPGPNRVQRTILVLWLPLMIVAITPYTTDPADPPKLLVTSMVLALAGVTGVFATLSRGQSVAWSAAPVRVLLAWLAVLAVSAIGATRLGLFEPAIKAWAVFAIPALAALVTSQAVRRADQAYTILGALVVGMGLASVYGFLQRNGIDPFPWETRTVEEYRGMPSFFANPNFAGHALVPSFFAALGIAFWPGRREPKHVAIWLAFALLLGAHLWLSGMRAGRIAVFAGLAASALFVGLEYLQGSRNAARTLLVTAAVGACIGVGLLAALLARGSSGLDFADNSVVLRLNGYHGAAQMALDRPMLGWGPGVYELTNSAYWTPYEERWYALETKRNNHVHSEPIEAAVEGGFLGAALFLGLIIASLWYCWTRLRVSEDPGVRWLGVVLSAAIVAMAIDSVFGFNFHVHAPAAIFALLIGLVSGLGATESRTEQKAAWARAIPHAGLATVLIAGFVFALAHMQVEMADFEARAVLIGLRGGAGSEDPAAKRAYSQRVERAAQRGLDVPVVGNDARLLQSLGSSHFFRGEYPPAAAVYERGLALEPGSVSLRLAASRSYWYAAQNLAPYAKPGGDAFAHMEGYLARSYDMALQVEAICPPCGEPNDLFARIAKDLAVAGERDPEEVAKLWREAQTQASIARASPTDNTPHVLRVLAESSLALGDFDGARDALAALVQRAPDLASTLELLRRYRDTDDNPEAYRALLESALRAESLSAAQYARLAALLGRSYLVVPALEELGRTTTRKAIEGAPSGIDVWGAFGLAHNGSNEILRTSLVEAKASIAWSQTPVFVQRLDDALSDPRAARWRLAAEALAQQAWATRRAREPAEVFAYYAWATDAIRRGVERGPDASANHAALWAALGDAMVATGDYEAGLETIENALPHTDPSRRAHLHIRRSEALAGLDRFDQAADAAELALRRAGSESVPAQYNYAERLFEAGRYAEAAATYAWVVNHVEAGTATHLRANESRAYAERLAGTDGSR